MADLTKGYTFGTNEAPTPESLHELVEKAVISNVVYDDLIGTQLLHTGSGGGTPADGDLRTNASTGLIQGRSGGAWVDLGSPMVTISMTNNTNPAVTIFAGDTVRVDEADATGLGFRGWEAGDSAVHDPAVVVGIAAERINPSAAGAICVRGRIVANVLLPAAAATAGLPGDYLNMFPGTGFPNHCTYDATPDSSSNGSSLFARTLEALPINATNTAVTAWVQVFR